MEDFAAIDFETANAQRSSVCSVGVVIVRGGEVVDEIYRLIRPVPEWYHQINISVHGLTEADTADAPPFPEVWAEIAPKVEGLTLVAHNAAFDSSCLRAVMRYYRMPDPGYTFLCTYRAARRLLCDELPNFRLPTVAAYCGYDLESHHHALADAAACAAIARRLL